MTLKISKEIGLWVHENTNNSQIQFDRKPGLALAVFQHALDIADGIIVLIEQNLPGVAWTLVRSLHECYVRGVWLLEHADNNQLDNFEKGVCPTLNKLTSLIGSEPESAGVWIKGINDKNISVFHDLTHGGMEHVSRRITANSIEPNYSDEETVSLLKLRNQYYINIGVFLLAIFQNESALIKLNEKTEQWKESL